MRDLGFMIPDVLHLIIPLGLICKKRAKLLPGAVFCDSKFIIDLLFMTGAVCFGLGLCSIL